MRLVLVGLGLFVMLGGAASADEEPMRQAIASYQDAFNQRDLSTIESLWSENAILEDVSASTKVEGRSAIVGQLKEVFGQENPPTLSIATDSVVVQEDGSILISGTNTLTSQNASEATSESFAFQALIRSIDGKLQITRVTESALAENDVQASISPLQSIQWLVGSWSGVSMTETGESSGDQVINEFRWMPGDRFLVRTFRIGELSERGDLGYQMIGTLPGEEQLRSWTFLGDGSASQATWLVEADRILIESVGRLADGSQASGTYVLKRIDADTMTAKVVGHTINGEPIPSKGAIMLTRRAAPELEETQR